MSRFQRTHKILSAADTSRSSAPSLDPTLSTLSREDAEVLDAIIAKTPGATAFMTVFKAYSDVLQTRGLDPGNDVVYYKQLLKLGVIKGADWGTKWKNVKDYLGLDLPNREATPRGGERKLSSELTGLQPLRSQLEDDVFTLHSRADETETVVDPPSRPYLPFNRTLENEPSPTMTKDSSKPFDSSSERSLTPPCPPLPLFPLPTRHAPLLPLDFESSKEAPTRSSTPPLPQFCRNQTPLFVPRPKTEDQRERETSRINDAEAWKKIEQARRVQSADFFRREALLLVCFQTWKGGLDWIRTTHIQIVSARNHIRLQVYFLRWKRQVIGLRQIADRAMQVSRWRTQNVAFHLWKERAVRKRFIEWRGVMRNQMAQFKRKGEQRIRSDAWTKWYQLHLSLRLHRRNASVRAFRRWRINLRKVDNLEALAERFEDVRGRRILDNVMEIWSRRVHMCDAERYLVDKASHRILIISFETWIHNLEDCHRADASQTMWLVKKSFKTWRKAKEHNRILNSRGNKYIKRLNGLLLRAIVRVWVARERGQLLERVRNARLVKEAFLVWCLRVQRHRTFEDQAISFSQHGSRTLLMSVVGDWIRRHRHQQHNILLVEQHYITTLLYQTLLFWRLRLRAILKHSRKAKMARKYALERRAWGRWYFVLETKRRDHKLHVLKHKMLKQMFLRWLQVVRHNQRNQQAIKGYEQRARLRLLKRAVQHWIDGVVRLKLRELDIVGQYNRDTMSATFTKWKESCLRHVENLGLVNSFRDVKREETLRRMFAKWLTEARKVETRRTRLAERQHELRLETLAAAWEMWRDRFRENGLRDLEYQAIIQSQRSILYKAFVLWQSRSKSVPGIRLYATRLKAKVWNTWRAAIPLAIQARKARELHSRTILSTMFVEWGETYRKKIALKAVARARYLRLPSPGYRSAQTHNTPPLRPLLHRPLRSRVSATSHDPPNTSQAPESISAGPPLITRRKGLSSLVIPRPPSLAIAIDESVPRGKAPPVDDNDRRNRLWNELRGVGLTDLAMTSKAKSR